MLQPEALRELDARARRKARVILQSVSPPSVRPPSATATATFDVCVVGHLRYVKDPFRAAMAARLLPDDSSIRIVHIGSAMTAAMRRRAEAEAERNPRYVWLGECSRDRVWRTLCSSRAAVLSSRIEGGANAIGEAIVASTPVIASRISGNVGLLGRAYPGYFETGDTRGLAGLLGRVERDGRFRELLHARCAQLAPIFDPKREMHALAALYDELSGDSRHA